MAAATRNTSLAAVSLDELVSEPARVSALPTAERRRIVAQLAALIVCIEASPAPSAAASERTAADSGRDDDRLLRVPEAAEVLGFARSYVYELIRRGDLTAVKVGRQVRLRRSSLLEWARQHESA